MWGGAGGGRSRLAGVGVWRMVLGEDGGAGGLASPRRGTALAEVGGGRKAVDAGGGGDLGIPHGAAGGGGEEDRCAREVHEDLRGVRVRWVAAAVRGGGSFLGPR